MENKNFKKNWVMWTILVTLLFAIATPGIAIIPFGLSIYAVIKLVLIDKITEIDVKNYQLLKIKTKELENISHELHRNIQKGTDELSYLNNLIKEKRSKYELKLIYPFKMTDVASTDINNYIKKLELKEKELINKENLLLDIPTSNKRHYNNQVKQIIRLFNAETAILINSVTSKNIESMQNRIFKSFEGINKIFETDNVQIPTQLLDIKLEMLELVHKYQIKLEDEKIIRREERERIKEEEKAKKEMEKRLNELNKDIKHHNNEINKLTKYLNNTELQAEKELFIEKIKELEQSLQNLNTEKENISERQQKAQSGYVYIISNIGSFGENIYKIGVTRRLDPMDRINELSSASVPFEFDVHALIFSENAFELEKNLHQHFKNYKVNKVNGRKEFFKLNIEEIKNQVLKEHNNTVNFIDEPKAIQYKESLRLEIS
ncbi:DUF4041 domain-containing protein [Staphylococcus sp. Marseille-Q5304]|uniref:DUF4041 domain-containing protein n=1 Tax=Staphylococcus sp. Marseille-Q5304 TaxID=2942200 RepID=UPI00207425D2|nr:DUF4041 domain-containing protein [Staphylococcus sp. Marseille-Q5304]